MSFSFLFPGQGSQYNGMFQDHFEEFPEFSEVLGQGEEFYKENLKEIIFNDDDRLADTYYTQPILLMMSYALFQVWCNKGCPEPKVSLGHSLGEISSLLCAGAFTLEDALKLIKYRATFMIDSKGDRKTKMSAVLGLEGEQIVDILLNKRVDFLEAVNLNAPQQTVIAGNADEIESVKEVLKEAGAKRVIDLAVSVPSHSSLMDLASAKLKLVLDEININEPSFSTIQNFDARVSISVDEMRYKLAEQISNPVQWVESMKKLKKYGIEEHFEMGPGKVLSSLGKQNRLEGSFSAFDNIDTFKEKISAHGK